jgi:hypothetical protein
MTGLMHAASLHVLELRRAGMVRQPAPLGLKAKDAMLLHDKGNHDQGLAHKPRDVPEADGQSAVTKSVQTE